MDVSWSNIKENHLKSKFCLGKKPKKDKTKIDFCLKFFTSGPLCSMSKPFKSNTESIMNLQFPYITYGKHTHHLQLLVTTRVKIIIMSIALKEK